jgi:hypothetical protein
MSYEEQDREMGRFMREHGDRRRAFAALTTKLKKIGQGLQGTSTVLMNLNPDAYSLAAEGALRDLELVRGEVDVSGLLKLIEEHRRLTQQLVEDQQTLKQFGVEH